MAIIVSYGAGVDSTAMLIWMTNNKIIPTAILFANTGGEQQETYDYKDNFSIWLQQRGMPAITEVSYQTKDGNNLTLEQDCLNNNTIPSVAFGWKSCSQKFKLAPQYKWVKSNTSDCELIQWYIGFNADEPQRQFKNATPYHYNNYPLIMCGFGRDKCKEIIIDAGLCVPPKSSCFYCPNMKKGEILSLPDNLKERVKKMEANATKLSELKGLGRTYAWTDLINADQSQHKLFDDLDLFRTPCHCTT